MRQGLCRPSWPQVHYVHEVDLGIKTLHRHASSYFFLTEWPAWVGQVCGEGIFIDSRNPIWVWQQAAVIFLLGRLRHEDGEFEANLRQPAGQGKAGTGAEYHSVVLLSSG